MSVPSFDRKSKENLSEAMYFTKAEFLECSRQRFHVMLAELCEMPSREIDCICRIGLDLYARAYGVIENFRQGYDHSKETTHCPAFLEEVLSSVMTAIKKKEKSLCSSNMDAITRLGYLWKTYNSIIHVLTKALRGYFLWCIYKKDNVTNPFDATTTISEARSRFKNEMQTDIITACDAVIGELSELRAGGGDQSRLGVIEKFLSSTQLLFIDENTGKNTFLERVIDTIHDYYSALIAVFIRDHTSDYTIDYIRFAQESVARERSIYTPPSCCNLGAHTQEDKEMWLTEIATKINRIFIDGHETGIARVVAASLIKQDHQSVQEVLRFISIAPDSISSIVEIAIHSYISTTTASSSAPTSNWNMRVSNLVDTHNSTLTVLEQCLGNTPHKAFYNAAWRNYFRSLGAELSVRAGEYCNYLFHHIDRNPGKFELVARFAAALPDLDFFFDSYKTGLAKRLLTHGSVSPLENTHIGYFRLTCGQMEISSVEGMLKDAALWEGYAKVYNGLKFHPLVCTLSAWPRMNALGTEQPVDWIPDDLRSCMTEFSSLYTSRHESRKLKWAPAASTCTLSAVFKSGNKTIQCSLRQAVILLKFNDNKSVASQSEPDETALVNAKLLISQSDKLYAINEEFASPNKEIRITMKSQPKEISAETSDAILRDRAAVTQACITRIMKTRKTSVHTQLLADVCAQLTSRFQADTYFVKKQIEELIELRYIKRDAQDPKIYHYIA